MRRTTTHVAWLFALLVLALACPTTASAHAELTGTQPANEATIDDRPDEVTLTFTEDVEVPFGGVKAYAPDGSRADHGEARVDGDVVTAPLESDAEGTYAVSWRAISADGHPIRGAFVFHVGKRSSDSTSRDEALAASEGSRAKDIAFGIARGGYLLGILAAAGGVLFLVLVAPTWRPRLLVPSLVLAIASVCVAYVLDASIAAGTSLGDTLDADLLREQAGTVYGEASVIRLVALVGCLVLALVVVPRRWSATTSARVVLGLAFAALAATLSISGHAVGEGATALRLPLDMLHSIAAAAWLGGLVQLLAFTRVPLPSVPAVRRWSRLAMASVVVLVLTGLHASWQEIGLSFDALVETRYGWLVLAKSALLVATMPLANVNRTRHVRRMAEAGTQEEAVAGMRRLVRGELAILVAVIAVTAWLVQVVPAKVEQRPDRFEQVKELPSGGTMQLIVDPASLGTNEVHVYAFDEHQQPDQAVTDVKLTASTPDNEELGSLDIELDGAGPGHYTTDSATIPFAGDWTFTASLRRGEFEEERARFSVPISSRSNQE